MLLEKLNLQLFANDDLEDDDIFLNDIDDLKDEEIEEEIEEEEVEEDIEDEDIPEDEDEDEEDDEEDDEEEELEEPNKKLDKKTKAIIKHKKENKELRKQLQQMQERLHQLEMEKERSKLIEELTKDGKSLTEAEQIVNAKLETKQLKTKLAMMELEKLEDKYPGITAYASQLVADKEKLPEFSYEQIYLAKYYKESEFDRITKLEQEMLYRTKQSKSKALDSSSSKPRKGIKLSPEDERAYRILKKKMPKLTRKKYLELMNMDELG